ncbi:beta-lactamase/transpeptidase-like protein [Trametes meyenii]|nr:beta-lactamase/transpeptidase-like protein [Trametes meyenii]
MPNFEKRLEQAIAEREIPPAVLFATNKSGSWRYWKAFGPHSLADNTDQRRVNHDSIMWIASCTKLQTSIAVMQCVERGILNLDEPVYAHLPELKDREILTGFDASGQPTYRANPAPITLRHLLTHASGLGYHDSHPLLVQWRRWRNHPGGRGKTVVARYHFPLLFEPGTSWMYGCGNDWAGLLVARATGSRSLEDYLRANVWEPLGLTNFTFSLSARPDLAVRRVPVSDRDADTGKVFAPSKLWRDAYEAADEPLGGQGLYGCAREYAALLESLLRDDGRLLSSAGVERLFARCLSAGSKEGLVEALREEPARLALGGAPRGTRLDYACGGLVFAEGIDGWRSEGTVTWGGYPNLTWWIDRKAGVTGCWFGQLVPTGDAKIVAMTRRFEEMVYAKSKVQGKL